MNPFRKFWVFLRHFRGCGLSAELHYVVLSTFPRTKYYYFILAFLTVAQTKSCKTTPCQKESVCCEAAVLECVSFTETPQTKRLKQIKRLF